MGEPVPSIVQFCRIRLSGLGGTEAFNNDLTQCFFAAEALDSIQDFYAGQLSVCVVVSPLPLSVHAWWLQLFHET